MKSMWDVVLGMREISGILEQWGMVVRDLPRRLILAPTPRERERWYAISLLAQGWTATGVAEALDGIRTLSDAGPPPLAKGVPRP